MKTRRSSISKSGRMLILAMAMSSIPALAQQQGCAYMQQLMADMSDMMGQISQSMGRDCGTSPERQNSMADHMQQIALIQRNMGNMMGHCADATSDMQKQKIEQMRKQMQQIMKDMQRSSPAGRSVDGATTRGFTF